VLVVLNSDGYAEIFGPPEVVAHVALRLATDGGNAAEIAADELLTAMLPKAYRKLYFPRNLRASGIVEKRTAADEIARRAALGILADLRDLKESLE
jgi:hypothetical protein